MPICVKCGNQLENGSRSCSKCGNPVQELAVAPNKIQPVAKNNNDLVRESFSTEWGIGKPFTFTNRSLIYNNVEYPYKNLSRLYHMSAPTPLTNGCSLVFIIGKPVKLMYALSDKDRFNKAFEYANRQIDAAHGSGGCKFIFRTEKKILEVHSNSITIIMFPSGNQQSGVFSVKLSNVFDVKLEEPSSSVNGKLIIICSDIKPIYFPVKIQNLKIVREIVRFINESKNQVVVSEKKSLDIEPWKIIQGEERIFNLFDRRLIITANLDAFNQYRLRFRELAVKLSDIFKKEYAEKIYSFDTFVHFFPEIYSKYQAVIIQRSVDILILENIWSVTFDSFVESNNKRKNYAVEDYSKFIERAENTLLANREKILQTTSQVPQLVGGGFGLRGALEGIAIAHTFNSIRNSLEYQALRNADIKPDQKIQLYNSINLNTLFYNVFVDYFNVFVTLVDILVTNGKKIWVPTAQLSNQAGNIFQNMSNPNFPQDRFVEAMIDLIKTNPYKKEYYKFMFEKFGDTDEVKAISEYFGFTDFDDIRVC